MSRMDDIYKFRKVIMEELKDKVTTEQNISLMLIQANLMEISDTFAMMYDKMCDKPSGKWIPVSERLPDTEDKVLCWYEYYHWSKEEILPEYGIGQYIVNEWYGEVSVGLNARVIAWQPLPKPYKMESEDKE